MRAHGPNEDDVNAAVATLEKPLDLTEFGSMLVSGDHGPIMKPVLKPLLEWILRHDRKRSFDLYMALLTIMQVVLSFEWDRPFFQYWYANRPKFAEESLEKALDELPSDGTGEWADFRNLVREYRDEVARYLASEQPEPAPAALL